MSHIQSPQHSQIAKDQQGAVLIVVLLFLVLIILVGVIAVRQSTTDLKLATSDQVNTLLLQSADNANQNIEQAINSNSDTDLYRDMISRSGPFGHFMLSADNRNHEYVFCFRPRGRFFDINKVTIAIPNGGVYAGSSKTKGYCNPSTPDDYISARNASMTQVNISLTPPNATNEAFNSYTIGKDSNEISSQAFMFDINSTAILPTYSGATGKAEECFKKSSQYDRVTNKEKTIAGCMAKAGVPSTVVYEQAIVENQSKRTKCVDFGKGDGLLCTLPSS